MPDTHATAAADPIQAERARVVEIGNVVSASRGTLPQGILDRMQRHAVAEGWSANTLRSSLWTIATGLGADLVRAPQPLSQAASMPDQDGVADIRDAMAEAMAVRAMPRYAPTSTRHSDYLAMHPLDMAEELLRMRGEDARTRDPLVIAERALTTTSDFPLLLAAAANKMLLAGYQAARPTYQGIFHRRDFKDF